MQKSDTLKGFAECKKGKKNEPLVHRIDLNGKCLNCGKQLIKQKQ